MEKIKLPNCAEQNSNTDCDVCEGEYTIHNVNGRRTCFLNDPYIENCVSTGDLGGFYYCKECAPGYVSNVSMSVCTFNLPEGMTPDDLPKFDLGQTDSPSQEGGSSGQEPDSSFGDEGDIKDLRCKITAPTTKFTKTAWGVDYSTELESNALFISGELGSSDVENNVDGAKKAKIKPSLSSSKAKQIDVKIDDGNPNTGSVRGIGSDTNSCSAGSDYDMVNKNNMCGLLIKLDL
jgi:hypothetical protein